MTLVQTATSLHQGLVLWFIRSLQLLRPSEKPCSVALERWAKCFHLGLYSLCVTQGLCVLSVHFREQPEPDDKDLRGGHHGSMTHRFPEVTCPKCGWVHVAIQMDVARANSDTDEDLERYLKCFRCGEPTFDFVPALEGDAPMGCTLQAVVLTASD